MHILLALLLLASTAHAVNPCRQLNEPCSPSVPCCAPLTCTTGTGKHCVAGQTTTTVPGTVTTTTVKPTTVPPATVTTTTLATPTTTSTRPTTTSTTVPPSTSQTPVRPTSADIGQALLAGKGRFYTWYRGDLADQPVRDAMQQYVTGVLIPELSRVLETACPQVIAKAYRGEGGTMDVVYRRLGNVYENLATVWSIGPNGRNYSFPEAMLEDLRDCLVGKPEVPGMTVADRDALTLHVVAGNYARWDPAHPSFFVFPQPKANEQIGKRAPVNVRLSFPPKAHGADLLIAANNAHAAASGIGLFPLGVDQAAQAYEADAKSRDELHFRQMKRFTGFCDPRWGSDGCQRWKGVQHHFFACWTAAEAAGNWRDARNCDSDHQLSHICTNYMNPDLDVRFSVPGVDEHDWPIMNCVTALARLAP